MVVGVLAMQGAFREHCQVIRKLGHECIEVRTSADLEKVERLILPGGESTTQGKLLKEFGLDKAIQRRVEKGMPVMGTCAGAILMAKDIIGSDQPRLGIMDIAIKRNDYGRQIDSFEKDIETGFGSVHGIFIRAPVIKSVGSDVKILAKENNNVVIAQQGGMLAVTFHPELTADTRLHEYFVALATTHL